MELSYRAKAGVVRDLQGMWRLRPKEEEKHFMLIV
jgi:hypothetical protein